MARRVNLSDNYDYCCDQLQGPTRTGADPAFENTFPGYPTSQNVGPVAQYLPPGATDHKHHYFYEVTLVPRPPEDSSIQPNDSNRFRSYGISCDSARQRGSQECYFDENRRTGTGS